MGALITSNKSLLQGQLKVGPRRSQIRHTTDTQLNTDPLDIMRNRGEGLPIGGQKNEASQSTSPSVVTIVARD